jgi:hypothetical protein
MAPTLTTLKNAKLITKTYQLCRILKFNGLRKSKLYQYPSPMMGNGYKWSVGALNDVYIWSHHTLIHKLLNSQLHLSPLILCLEQITNSMNPKMAQLFMKMSHKAFTFIWAKHHLHSSICSYPQKGITFTFEPLGLMHNTIPFFGC